MKNYTGNEDVFKNLIPPNGINDNNFKTFIDLVNSSATINATVQQFEAEVFKKISCE